jgi:very-short-patch-repair endonuclease
LVIPYNPGNKETSRILRRRPTPAERCLWKRLRLKHFGFIFHRQKPIGDYIADFYCPKAKLVVEVDGGYHAGKIVSDNDKARDKVMHDLKITVLRFTNTEVLDDTDKVVKAIDEILLESF